MRKIKFFAALCCTAMLFAACEKSEPKSEPKEANNHDTKNDTKEAVDLGLSVKWATCNVGATKPEEYGNYYAWGETTSKDDYSWETYKFGTYNDDYNYSKLTKYNETDGKTILEAADDAATQNWGSNWRMPTIEEWQELINNCTWTWTALNGVNGYQVKASNGKAIFLPAAGYRDRDALSDAGSYGNYWSSSLNTGTPHGAQHVYFISCYHCKGYGYRDSGHSVRPVCK